MTSFYCIFTVFTENFSCFKVLKQTLFLAFNEFFWHIIYIYKDLCHDVITLNATSAACCLKPFFIKHIYLKRNLKQINLTNNI